MNDSDSQLVMEGVCVVGRQNGDIADILQLRAVAMATIFGFLDRIWVHKGVT